MFMHKQGPLMTQMFYNVANDVVQK